MTSFQHSGADIQTAITCSIVARSRQPVDVVAVAQNSTFHTAKFFAQPTNPAAAHSLPFVIRHDSTLRLVRVRRYRSVAAPSRSGNDNWAGKCDSSSAFPPFVDRQRGTRPVDLNLGRALRAWSVFRSLIQACKQSASCICKCLGFTPWFIGFHVDQPKRGPEVWRTQIKGISNP